MKQLINVLADSVLPKEFRSYSELELRDLIEKYPYSSTLQLLYSQKLKENNSEDLPGQMQKTLLYYNNPLFIQYVIHNQDAPAIKIIENAPAFDELAKEDEENPQPLAAVQKDEEQSDLPALPEFKIEPMDPTTAELSFTPYHTIDYFAAQGIKLSDEQNKTVDRFSTQLKSFTEWLKQMKRLPGATTAGNISLTEERNIEKMAEQSLSGKNADTEAMAEVWIKQGNRDKAIEIYQKLSLLNPAKSAYFAAKIDHLKKSI